MALALRAETLAYLGAHNSMTLATVGEDAPWAAGVFYVNRGFTLYFLSDPNSRHCVSLARSPRVGAAIHEDYFDWRDIKGIQLEGVASAVTGRWEQAQALAVYLAKFPYVASFLGRPLRLSKIEIGGKKVSVKLYKVAPEHIYFLDNSKGFSHRDEVIL